MAKRPRKAPSGNKPREVFERVRARVVETAGPSAPAACLYWAAYGMEELAEAGVEACFQAGSCFWPRVRAEDAHKYPETEPLNFGYQWDTAVTVRDAVVRSLATGRLPEVHVWLGVVRTQEIIDFAAGQFPQNCLRLLGRDWPGDGPPEFFWGPCKKVPAGVLYAPDPAATIAAAKLAEALLGDGVVFV